MDCLAPHTDNSRREKTARSTPGSEITCCAITGFQAIYQNCSCTLECELLHHSSPCFPMDSTVDVWKVVPRITAVRGSPTIRSYVAAASLGAETHLRKIF